MILKPLISEKSMSHTSLGIYTFIIDSSMSKPEIAKQIHELFKVDVLSVRILNRKGKLKKYKKTSGKRSDRRIAMVHIDPKQKINGFEIEVPAEEKNEDKN
ncbi:50S ribosomal protein L23, partial [Candidatus Berkelbacteria bacterium]|nr:50S ribosomal protein L23 [Candidatus Berkelbacteria bacterium]